VTDTRVNGFLVLRRPEFNRDPEGRGAFTAVAPCLDGRCYGGVDRMPWFDVDEARYGGTLPPELGARWEGLREGNADLAGLVLAGLDDARALLAFSNRGGNANELAAVRGSRLDALKGTLPAPAAIDWLGWDVVSLGWWSLLSVVFAVPAAFPGWAARINPHGLLESPDDAQALAQAYADAEARGEVEPLPEPVLGIELIRVGRVRE
jgi:hypothetical protein